MLRRPISRGYSILTGDTHRTRSNSFVPSINPSSFYVEVQFVPSSIMNTSKEIYITVYIIKGFPTVSKVWKAFPSAMRKNSSFSPAAWLLRQELSRQRKPRKIVWDSGLRNFSFFKSAGPDLWQVLVEVFRKSFCRAGLWNTRFWDRFLSKTRNSVILTKVPKLAAAEMRCCPCWNWSF